MGRSMDSVSGVGLVRSGGAKSVLSRYALNRCDFPSGETTLIDWLIISTNTPAKPWILTYAPSAHWGKSARSVHWPIGCGVPEKSGSVIALREGVYGVTSDSGSGVVGDCMGRAAWLARTEIANGF